MPRPKEVTLAILFAALAVVIRTSSVFFARSLLGDGWILFASFSVLMVPIYAVFLILAYNGTNWVRYTYLILFVIGILRLGFLGLGVFLNPWILASVVVNVIALGFWFSRSSAEWYAQRPSKVANQRAA